jgi:histidyl-tRNA synthetase
VTKQQRIKPRTLKGFRDFLPAQMMAREFLIDTARQVYRSYGFSPIDTPALEYAEILLGKGGDESDKQLFRFTDQGKRDVAMRFDLTIPLARYAAQNFQKLGTPFKRYHIATVWRGENPQKGRYREFMQCDFDTIGTTSNTTDIETLFVINDLLERIGFERFTIRVNNRLVLNGVLETLGLPDQSVGVLRALDKLPKIGRDAVAGELIEKVGISADQARQVLDFAQLGGTSDDILSQLRQLIAGNESGEQGLANLAELFAACSSCGLPNDRVVLDVSIARGLDYYTGTIYETFLGDLPGIGSVCSGGRYDNLAELFTSQPLPGVGASLGLDRLLAAMDELKMLPEASTPASILVTQFDKERRIDYLSLARLLRSAGFATEVFADAKAIGKQMKYANNKGFRLAIIAGPDEFASGSWQVKDLAVGSQETIAQADLVKRIGELIGRVN